MGVAVAEVGVIELSSLCEQTKEYREGYPSPREEARWFAAHVRAGHLTVEEALACMDTPPEVVRLIDEVAESHPEDAALLRRALEFRRSVREEFQRLVADATGIKQPTRMS